MPEQPHVQMKDNKPALAFDGYAVNGTFVAASKLTENRTLHVSGKITHGKKGDYVVTTLVGGLSFILPAEAAALVLAPSAAAEAEPGFDEAFDNVYVV